MNSAELQPWLHQHGFTSNDLDLVGPSGLTPLMRAARQGEPDIVLALLDAGANLNIRNHDGNNALWFACVGEHTNMIALLVERGIDIDNQNDNGASCLMYASSTGKEAVVQSLLDHGADATLTSLDDFTALDVAATIGCLQLLRTPSTHVA